MIKLFLRLTGHAHRRHIAHLEREIVWLRVQMSHERQRAEVAVDTLLMSKAQLGPVTLPPRPEGPPETDRALQELLNAPDFAALGDAVTR